MFIALNENKQRVNIDNAIKGGKYFCPACGEQLIVKAKDSMAIKAHFAHKKGTDCDDFTHDMSEWHLNWQKQFPEKCREVVVENSKEKHRADVLIKNTVIEFQHSPISADEIARRNDFYLSCGYQMVWVFDADGQIKNEYGESIDPAKCRENDFVWKRAKQQFSKPMDSRVTVYIHYKTELSVPELAGKQIGILLLLTSIDPKDITYFRTIIGFNENGQINEKYFYILPANFVKQYYDSFDDKTIPVGTYISESKKYKKQIQEWIDSQKRTIQIPFLQRRGRRF